MKKIILLIISIFLISLLGIFILKMWKFAGGEMKDMQRIKEKVVSIMKSIDFTGVIIHKEIYGGNSAKLNHWLTLSIKKINKNSVLSDFMYSPYYRFESDSIISVIIGKIMYNDINLGDTIKKNSGSDKLILLKGGQVKEYQWLNIW